MTNTWQRIHLPTLERLALAELALRRGVAEEALLVQLVRDAVQRELLAPETPSRQQPVEVSNESA